LNKKEEKIVSISILVLISILSYANSLNNSFVWDDNVLIVENDFVKNPKYFKEIFSKDFFDISGVEFNFKYGYYRPVITLSYLFDYYIWKLNFSGFHLTNILLHAFNSILIYLILFRLLESGFVPFLTSIIFAAHPIHTESVAWISGRTDVICGFFFFLSFYFYQKGNNSGKINLGFYLSSVLCFAASLLSKEMALSLPFILMIYDFLFYPEKNYSLKKRIISVIPFFAVIGIYSLIRFVILKIFTINELDKSITKGITFYSNVLSFLKTTIVVYLWKLFFPVELVAYIQNKFSLSLFEPEIIISIVVLVLLLVLIVKCWKKERLVSFSVSFFLLSMIPLSNFIRISGPRDMGFMSAERFLYITSFSFSLFLAVLFGKLINDKKRKNTAYIIIIILLLSFIIRTIDRNSDWKDNKTLFTKTIKLAPESSLLNHIMGNEMVREKKFDEAIRYYSKALSLNPYSYASFHNMGVIYFDRGEIEEAVSSFLMALEIKPDYIQSRYNIGLLYDKIGLEDEAMSEFKEVLKITQRYPQAHNSLGVIYAKRGFYEDAEREFTTAIELDPEYELAKVNLKNLEDRKSLDFKNQYDTAVR